MGASVQGDAYLISANGDVAAGLDEFAVELFGLHGPASFKLLGEPAVTAVR